jgi:hypothetical protein
MVTLPTAHYPTYRSGSSAMESLGESLAVKTAESERGQLWHLGSRCPQLSDAHLCKGAIDCGAGNEIVEECPADNSLVAVPR